ncbi:MAG: hypothetical protein GTO55_03900 [Armatimonadetes bacterium]|nr:hypothetical protein [Armatimonadota bacterium]NIM23416.1 hypothetical protein [Armatimonadota bacterium]NIM67281.1 hypothetical protein [Armatimonadota bacterium]NIM75779.1 hypothetical protein [Armatimonadota bacterium]NIN05467.1 hypothetical protein [Armatimonadota bacterium]
MGHPAVANDRRVGDEKFLGEVIMGWLARFEWLGAAMSGTTTAVAYGDLAARSHSLVLYPG